MFTIKPTRELPPDIDELAMTARAEGMAMVLRLVDDYRTGQNRFDAPGEGLWLASTNSGVVGVCGLNRDPFVEPVERVGRVRRLYVRPEARRCGVAAGLLQQVVAAARPHFELLSVYTTNPGAMAFYRAQGFRSVTGTPRRSFELMLRERA